jgi:GGDEF domain-containing protein
MVVDGGSGHLGDGDPGSPGDLLKKTDTAPYRAKRRGKVGYEVFDPISNERLTS